MIAVWSACTLSASKPKCRAAVPARRNAVFGAAEVRRLASTGGATWDPPRDHVLGRVSAHITRLASDPSFPTEHPR